MDDGGLRKIPCLSLFPLNLHSDDAPPLNLRLDSTLAFLSLRRQNNGVRGGWHLRRHGDKYQSFVIVRHTLQL